MKIILALLSLLCSLSFCYADPSIDDVSNAVNTGNYTKADQMVDQVIEDHPQSAKAYYVKSQVLVKEGKFDEAKIEMTKAVALDPTGSFTSPEKLASFQSVLAESMTNKTTPKSVVYPSDDLHFLYIIMIFICVVIAFVFVISWFINIKSLDR